MKGGIIILWHGNEKTKKNWTKVGRKKWSVARRLQKKLLLRKLQKTTEKKPLEYYEFKCLTDEKNYLCVEYNWILDPNEDYELVGRMADDDVVEFY